MNNNGNTPDGLMTKKIAPISQSALVTRSNDQALETAPPSDWFPNFETIKELVVRESIRRLRSDAQRIAQRLDTLEKLVNAKPVTKPDSVLNSFVELNIGPGDSVSGFVRLRAGHGSPEGVLQGSAGRDAYYRTDGTAATFLYLKETGEGTTGWRAVGAAVADATGAGDVVAQLNAWLARARSHGLIAP